MPAPLQLTCPRGASGLGRPTGTMSAAESGTGGARRPCERVWKGQLRGLGALANRALGDGRGPRSRKEDP